MRKVICFIPVLIIGLFLLQCGTTQPPIKSANKVDTYALDQTIPMDPNVQVGQLENGIRYYIRENGHPENRAELRLVVNAGSILEDEDQQGLAHFVEHMAFNGTKHFEKQALINYLEMIGMRFGPEINAYTGFEETVYMLELPTDSTEIMETAFQILEDWAHYITFDSTEIEKERGVIREEWRQGRGVNARIRDQQFPVVFKNSQYAERLPIGKMAVIDTFHHEVIKRFYKDWYRPDLMAVVAVGDFDGYEIESFIHKYFSQINTPNDKKERVSFPVPDHKETLISVVTDPEATQTSLEIYYKKPIQMFNQLNDYRNMVIENIYDALLNQRLNELTKLADPPFLYAYGGNTSLCRTKDVYVLGAGIKDNDVLVALKNLMIEAERVRQHGFTRAELERQKKIILRRMEQAYRERNKTKSNLFAAEYGRHFLENEPMPGVEKEYDYFQYFVPEIHLDEVNQWASNTIIDSNRVILVSGAEKDKDMLPSNDVLLATIDSVLAMKIEPYKEDVSQAPLIAKIPESGSIIKTNYIGPVNVTEWTLSNGIKVVLKPTDFKNDEILFTSYSLGGNSLVSNEDYLSALAATSILSESGLGSFNSIELKKKLAGKMMRVRPYIGELTEGISGSSTNQDLETMFQLIYLTFTAPRKDSTAFISYISRMKGFIENREDNPETAYNDTIRVTLSQYHHRSRSWKKEMLDEIDMKKAFEFYQDRFKDPSDFTFIFVGSFNLDSIQPLILTYLGGLNVLDRKETWKDLNIIPPDGPQVKRVYRGLESKGRVYLYISGDAEYSRWNRYVFGSMIDVLRIKLREVLREDLSGTYGVSIGGQISEFPKEDYTFNIGFGCDPHRIDELVQTVYSQIDSIATYGIDSSYIKKVTETQLRNYEVSIKDNGVWMNTMHHVQFHHGNIMNILNYPELVHKLTPNDVQNAVKQYIKTDKVLQFNLYPESYKETSH